MGGDADRNLYYLSCDPGGSARTIALEAGEIDVVWSVDPTDCANVESNPDVKLLSQPSTGIDYVGMNTQKESF